MPKGPCRVLACGVLMPPLAGCPSQAFRASLHTGTSALLRMHMLDGFGCLPGWAGTLPAVKALEGPRQAARAPHFNNLAAHQQQVLQT